MSMINNGLFGTWNNSTYSTSTNFDYTMGVSFVSENKAIDIERIINMSKEKRSLIKIILYNFFNETDYNTKQLLFNTLYSYNLIVDKKSLERKVKIDNILKEDNEKK